MEINHTSSRSSLADDKSSIHSGLTFITASKEVIINCKHSVTRDIYCKTHRIMTCRTCLIKQHGMCEIQSIEDVARDCDKKAIDKMNNDIDSITMQINVAIKEMENEKSSLHNEKVKAIQKIKDFKTEMLKHLDAFEKEALHNLDLMFNEHTKNAKEQLQQAKECLATHTCRLNALVAEEEQSITRIVECKASQKAITETREAFRRFQIQIPEIKFIPDPKLFDVMTETTSLGICQLHFNRDPTVLYEIVEKHEIRVVPEKSSNNCNITGADQLPDGHILLTDRSNKKLLRLESASHKVKDHIQFSSEPWAVCVLHKTVAVVSFPEEQKNIKFINIAKKMKVSSALKLRHTCRGIAFDGEELFVTDQGVFVYVYTKNGTLLRKFSKDGHVESKLTDFYAIAIRGSLIVVADWNEGLLAFDKSGKLIWKYYNHDLKRASGLCFDENGNILACGSQSINVIHINKEGTKIGEIANTSNGLLYPTALCFDNQRSILIAAQQEANAVVFRVQ